MKIVVIGSSNIDMIMQTPRIPRPGETILGGAFSTASGGKGANQAVAAARLGAEVTFVARVGDDAFGSAAIERYQKDKISTDHISLDPETPTGVAVVTVDKNGENSISVASGANMNLTPELIDVAFESIESTNILLMQLETPLETIRHAAKRAKAVGVKVILNPAPAQELPSDLLRNVSVLTPNESEAELLTGIEVMDESSAKRAARELLSRGLEAVIITMGKKGALVSTAISTELIAGSEVEAIDTTGAGDVFNGALSVALAKGLSLQESCQYANTAAALSATKLGAQPSIPYRQDVESFLKSQASQ